MIHTHKHKHTNTRTCSNQECDHSRENETHLTLVTDQAEKHVAVSTCVCDEGGEF